LGGRSDSLTDKYCFITVIWRAFAIGAGVVVVAGTVVTNDVYPWTIVGGIPAKFIKKRVLSDETNS